MQNTTLPDTALAIIIGVVSGIITAAIIWSLAQVVKKNVIPCYGTNGFTPLHDKLIGNAGKPVVIALDNDGSGKKAAEKLSRQLTGRIFSGSDLIFAS